MGQWYMGRAKELFDEPNEFKPERWLNSDLQKASNRHVDEILKPFALGPRDCIGKLCVLSFLLTRVYPVHTDWFEGSHLLR